MKGDSYPQCVLCEKRLCFPRKARPEGKNPAFCPSETRREILEAALTEYDKPENKEFCRLSSVQEFECYEWTDRGLVTRQPRVEETINFAKKMGYKRLGIAFCAGLINEAKVLAQILENNGFEVASLCCKCGGIPKERIGLKEEEKILGPGTYDTMCNPIAQAEIINAEKVDLAIMLGLCVGHDSTFIKYCKVPLTVLATKDRVFGHNPLAGLYLANSFYYHRLMRKA